MGYRVVFSGEVAEGKDVEEVKSEIGRVFRLDEAMVAKMFAIQRMVVKSDVDHETALKVQQAMSRCGGICHIEDMEEPSAASDAVPAVEEPESDIASGPEEAEVVAEVAADEEAEPENEATDESGVEIIEGSAVSDAPEAEVVEAFVEEQPEDAEEPDYDFSIREVLAESWRLTSGVKGTFVAAYGMMLLISFGLSIGFTLLQVLLGLAGIPSAALGMASQLTVTVALYPVVAGIVMIGVYRASGLPVRYKMIFGFFQYAVPIIIVNVLVTIFTVVGFLLLLLPGIYLAIAYVLAVPLVADRGMQPWQAMEASRRAVGRHWFKIFGLYLVMGMIVLVSVIPLGIGMIWTVPMAIILNGVLFRTVFGKSTAVEA